MLRKREPGVSPGLSRSGMQERPPSMSTGRKTGKRRPLGAPPWCVPVSPKTCRLCRARRAWRLTVSWNGRLAVTVAVAGFALHRFGYASVGGDHPVDVRTENHCDRYTVYRHRHRLTANRTETRTQACYRGLLGRPHKPLRAREGRRDPAPRHLGPAGRRRPGLRAGEYLLLLRPGAGHRCPVGCAAGAGAGRLRRSRPLFRCRPWQRGHRATGDDQVVRHQLPLHRPRDRSEHEVFAALRQSARGAQRGSGCKAFRLVRSSSGRSPSCC